MQRYQRPSVVVDNQRGSVHVWRDRVRDPVLTVLLALQLGTIFLAEPLAALGLPIARVVADVFVLTLVLIVVSLSQRRGAIVLIVLGLVATIAGFLLRPESTPVAV